MNSIAVPDSIVWVVQETPNNDYSPAEKYGELVFITSYEFRPIMGSPSSNSLLELIEQAAKKFRPAQDWLILTGNPIIMAYTFHLIFSKSTCGIRLLQWSRKRMEYHPVLFKRDLFNNCLWEKIFKPEAVANEG